MMSTVRHPSPHWYRKTRKCGHEETSKDGKRVIRCERYARIGTDRCPSQGRAWRAFDPQQTCVVIAAVFEMVAWGRR